MTEKQRNYIKFLDFKCKEKGLTIQSHQEDLLGEGWELTFKNITPKYAQEVINKLMTALGMPIAPKPKRKRK